MNLHEYQAKSLFIKHQVPVPPGWVVRDTDDLARMDDELGAGPKVVKAQIHAGGRGKAGGVRLVEDEEALREAVDALLGSRLVTHQTGPEGLPVHTVLVERATPIQHEYYVGLLVDRARERVSVMASAAGGMDIEQVAADSPGKILVEAVDPVTGLMPFQARKLGFALGLDRAGVGQFSAILDGLYRLFVDSDASLVEVNPLVSTPEGALVAVDGKVNLDDNALFRHKDLADWRDLSQEDPAEAAARAHGLNYIKLSGDIGCMVNGAGLAMATMDLIKLHGGEPANFLDVGGGTTAQRVAEAFKLILSDSQVRAILVNIFGGIVRCDLIAEGVIAAVQEVGVHVPVVVRLEGTNVEQGRALLAASGLDLISAGGLTEAARAVVAAAREARS